MSDTLHTDKTSAEDKSVGFDYQYYYFLNELLNLKLGQSVGLEVMDDVHTELANDKQILMQLKHTVQRKVDGTPANLTTFDEDFWKTLYNWSKVISDSAAGRSKVEGQIAFTEKTTFLLASNKAENDSNRLLLEIKNFHGGNISAANLTAKIQELQNETKNADIKQYAQAVIDLEERVAAAFFRNIRFDLGCDDIITRCKNSIIEHHIDDTRIDDVFRAIDSEVRKNNFLAVKKKSKITVTFNDFRMLYQPFFNAARKKLPKRPLSTALPDNLEGQIFIRQLLDINDLDANEQDLMREYTGFKLTVSSNLDRWCHDGDLTEKDRAEFESNAITTWRAVYRSAHRPPLACEADAITRAQGVLDSLRKTSVSLIDGETLSPNWSHGTLYDLSDRPSIGWRHDWSTKYK